MRHDRVNEQATARHGTQAAPDRRPQEALGVRQPLTADAGALGQVLTNLIDNAVAAMPGGGQLTLRTFRRDGEVVVAVEDTGAGMPPEVLARVFEPFFTTKAAGQGTGLGLALCHRVVTAHGGSLKFRSEPGKGTRAEVALPASRVAGVQEAARG